MPVCVRQQARSSVYFTITGLALPDDRRTWIRLGFVAPAYWTLWRKFAGWSDRRSRHAPERCRWGRANPQGWAFRLANTAPGSRSDGIHVTRRDVNEVQLAKAAIRAGIEVLLKENNCARVR